MLVKSNDICRFYGVQRVTLAKWISEGCPVETPEHLRGKGRHLELDTVKVARWRESSAVEKATNDDHMGKEEAQRRKIQAEASLAELEVVKKKGMVVDLGEIETNMKHQFAQFMTTVRKIPERAVMQLVGASEDEMKSILMDELDSALNMLVDGVMDDLESRRTD